MQRPDTETDFSAEVGFLHFDERNPDKLQMI